MSKTPDTNRAGIKLVEVTNEKGDTVQVPETQGGYAHPAVVREFGRQNPELAPLVKGRGRLHPDVIEAFNKGKRGAKRYMPPSAR